MENTLNLSVFKTRTLTIREHLFIAIAIGFFLRFFSAYFVWGPQALDDYLDNLIPAWKLTIGADPDLHDYRSPLYMWILAIWLNIGKVFQITNAISQIQWVYLFQGLISLLSIYGVYRITRSDKNRYASLFSMYIVAVHGLLPFASTRSFMESFVMGFVTISIALLSESLAIEKTDFKKSSQYLFFGAVILGFVSLVRFQVGIMYVAWILYTILRKNKKHILFFFIFGLVLIICEGAIDLAYGRKAFDTLRAYVLFNSDPTKSPSMPWYNTWLTLLLALYFPLSFFITSGWKKSIDKYFSVFIPVFAYVLIHSIAPHKEERYLYPILPLALVFLASALSEVFKTKWIKYFYFPLLGTLNLIILFIGCFINTQVGLIGPLGEIQKVSDRVLYLDYDHMWTRDNMSAFFVRATAQKISMSSSPNAELILSELNKFPDLEYVALLSQDYEAEVKKTYRDLADKMSCSNLREASSLSDQVLFALNPQKNERRKPTSYFYCQRFK